jgi:hypothetical protein
VSSYHKSEDFKQKDVGLRGEADAQRSKGTIDLAQLPHSEEQFGLFSGNPYS